MDKQDLFPRDGLFEKEIEQATSILNVEAREDVSGKVWLIVNRAELDTFLERCRKMDAFLERVDVWYDSAPERLGK